MKASVSPVLRRTCTLPSSSQEAIADEGTWVATTHPPTQLLGGLAYDSGRIAGIKYASAKHPGGLNLVVFPDRITVAAGNYLEVYDPHGNLIQRISA